VISELHAVFCQKFPNVSSFCCVLTEDADSYHLIFLPLQTTQPSKRALSTKSQLTFIISCRAIDKHKSFTRLVLDEVKEEERTEEKNGSGHETPERI